MSYQVLARKWRPRNFKQMVGQEHVLRALINALDNNRLHHAFLFTGTRGVGKTTISRILAKSLNCDHGVSANPCGECSSCREIDDGRFVDLIEVDAASRTKVEDTRELLENVQYAPTRGRYKVYLIDEVHMLSTHSFNALLKTLEEPPPHVKFLLATTDPQKLPVTILSRCLQFSLRRLSPSQIGDHLKYILEQEQIPFASEALTLIAHAADGSMRDALSLLDQAIAFGGGQVQESETRSMLGTIDRHHITTLLQALASQDGVALMDSVAQLSAQAPDYQAVCGEIISTLQRIAMLQMIPNALDSEELNTTELASLGQQMTPEEVQLYYQIALHMRRDLPLAPDARGGLEMGLLRMLAFNPVTEEPSPTAMPSPVISPSPSTNNTNPAAEALASVKKPVAQAVTATEPSPDQQPPNQPAATETPAKRSSPAMAALAAARSVLSGNGGSIEAVEPATADAPAAPLEIENNTPLPEEALPMAEATASHLEVTHQQAHQGNWAEIVSQLQVGGMTRQLAMHCTVQSHQADTIKLRLTPSHEQFINREREFQLQQALGDYFSSQTTIQIEVGDSEMENPMQIQQRQAAERQQAAEQSIHSDPAVHAMQRQFGAEIIAESIHPL